MERLDFRPHLFKRQLALHVTLIDGLCFAARFKPFQSNRSQGLTDFAEAFGPFLPGDLES
jgi:hypothetical protein